MTIIYRVTGLSWEHKPFEIDFDSAFKAENYRRLIHRVSSQVTVTKIEMD